MYDFFGNEPRTKAQLREYFLTWQRKLCPTNNVLKEHYVCEYEFFRHCTIYWIVRCLKTNTYLFWRFTGGDPLYKNFPTTHYPSFDTVMDGITDFYAKLWNFKE